MSYIRQYIRVRAINLLVAGRSTAGTSAAVGSSAASLSAWEGEGQENNLLFFLFIRSLSLGSLQRGFLGHHFFLYCTF